MPRLQKLLSILQHDTLDRPEFGSGKTARGSQRHRFQPESGDFALLLSVDVWQLGAFVAVEKEAKQVDSRNRRHREILPDCEGADSCRRTACGSAASAAKRSESAEAAGSAWRSLMSLDRNHETPRASAAQAPCTTRCQRAGAAYGRWWNESPQRRIRNCAAVSAASRRPR